ncbi:MAG: hypothetical protein LBJ32_02075 [Oscillospiraceae bacterium]|jgi:hypothetical protein|nr:hypothetical protein [Oscillospiraceae bacterium]
MENFKKENKKLGEFPTIHSARIKIFIESIKKDLERLISYLNSYNLNPYEKFFLVKEGTLTILSTIEGILKCETIITSIKIINDCIIEEFIYYHIQIKQLIQEISFFMYYFDIENFQTCEFFFFHLVRQDFSIVDNFRIRAYLKSLIKDLTAAVESSRSLNEILDLFCGEIEFFVEKKVVFGPDFVYSCKDEVY